MKIAIVGSYGAAEKSTLTDLLFTQDDDIGIRSYRSVETMTGDWRRPDFDLVVLMARVTCPNLAGLRRTLMTPILHVTSVYASLWRPCGALTPASNTLTGQQSLYLGNTRNQPRTHCAKRPMGAYRICLV
jgi:hypothetical protein